MLLFILSGEHVQLAQAEVEACCAPGERDGHHLLVDTSVLPTDLGFTREVHEVIPDDADYATLIPDAFIVRTHDGSDPREHAEQIWERIARRRIPRVALDGTEIHIFPKYRTLLRWRNAEPFAARRSHLRAANHPSSLNPKLARAMINLAGDAESILDPFCGAGGILIEGALMGREMAGVDIDPGQVERARANLDHYNLRATLVVGDARAIEGEYDAIVTDLPFGRNTKRVGAPDEFLARATRVTKRIVLANNAPLEHENWHLLRTFSLPLHRSLTKHVAILERRASSADP